jgi:hypothetical protein
VSVDKVMEAIRNLSDDPNNVVVSELLLNFSLESILMMEMVILGCIVLDGSDRADEVEDE